MGSLAPSEGPGKRAVITVALSRNRELTLTPETARGAPGFRLALVLHDGTAQRWIGGFHLARTEIYEVLMALQKLASTVDARGLPGE
jgi:hypothetical protein